MTLVVELSPEEEASLRERADAAGLDEAAYVRRLIQSDTPKRPEPANGEALPKTPAETLAYWEREGLFGLFAEGPDSPELARQIRKQAEKRAWTQKDG